MKEFVIKSPKGERRIGGQNPVFIIAEMSGNHHLNYDKAIEIIEAAAEAGADAIKLQTYTPDTMTIDSDSEHFIVGGKDQPDLWKGQKLYDLYKTAYTPWEWQESLKKIAEDLGLVFFSTPFDPTAVDFLEKMEVVLYKIASYESTDLILLRSVARTGKPVIISVGFATEEEVKFAIDTLRENGSKDIAVLHCITAYSDTPDPNTVNLRTMLDISKKFDVIAGFSDNNCGIELPKIAVAMGASIIEKHLIIDREEGGPDARFSLDAKDFKEMVKQIRFVEAAMGKVHYGIQSPKEGENIFFRRSLFVVEDIKEGEELTDKNVRSIRPSSGLPTKFYDEVIGKKAHHDIKRGSPLTRDMLS